MTARRVITLLILGVLVIAGAIWLSSKRHLERATLAGDLVLPGLEGTLNSVSEVRLIKGDGTRATLKRGQSAWTVGERDYPADSGKVRKLLLDLAALNVVEEKTRTAENYPQLGVEDVSSPKSTGTRVEAVTPGKTFAVVVGKSSSAKSGYVRVAGAPQSFLAAPLISLDADPKHWLDHTLLDIAQDRIREIAVKPAEGPGYTAARAKKEESDFAVTELPKGRELSSPAAADPIAGSLAGLTLDDVRRVPSAESAVRTAGPGIHTAESGAPPASSAPAAAATFRTFDGLEVEVTGRKEGTRTFISLGSQSTAPGAQAEAQTLQARLKGWEYEVPSYKYDGMFRSLEELLKKPPEAPSKAGTSPSANSSAKKQPTAVRVTPTSSGTGKQK